MSDGEPTSASWTHTVGGDASALIMFCQCGLIHTVLNAIPGGMSVIDCVCGWQCEVQH